MLPDLTVLRASQAHLETVGSVIYRASGGRIGLDVAVILERMFEWAQLLSATGR